MNNCNNYQNQDFKYIKVHLKQTAFKIVIILSCYLQKNRVVHIT